eukprot:462348_1
MHSNAFESKCSSTILMIHDMKQAIMDMQSIITLEEIATQSYQNEQSDGTDKQFKLYPTKDRLLWSAYNKMDTDDAGDIHLEEFRIAMHQLKVSLTNEEIEQIFRLMDSDDSGYFDMNEFTMFLTQQFESVQLTKYQQAIVSKISANLNLEQIDGKSFSKIENEKLEIMKKMVEKYFVPFINDLFYIQNHLTNNYTILKVKNKKPKHENKLLVFGYIRIVMQYICKPIVTIIQKYYGNIAYYCLKEIRPKKKTFNTQLNTSMLFNTEVTTLQKLHGHPNIMCYINCYIDNIAFYILTPLYDGGNLFDRLREVRLFNEPCACRVIYEVLRGIQYCHSHNIVHRNLQLSHILYLNDKHKELVIHGFYNALEIEESCEYKAIDPIGFSESIFHLGPELFRNSKGWELKKSDIWSVGVMCYMLLIGRPPFCDRDKKQIIGKILKGDICFPTTTKMSDECKDFILSLLNKQTNKRLSAKDALNHEWIKGKGMFYKGIKWDITEDELYLSTFGSSSKLKQLIVKTVSTHLSEKLQNEFEKPFLSLDLNNDGIVDNEELTQYLLHRGFNKMDAINKAEKIIYGIVGDTNVGITKQYWIYSNVSKLLSSETLIQKQFKKLDIDQNGYITIGDLSCVWEEMTRTQIADIVNEIDINGRIDSEQFKAVMKFEPVHVPSIFLPPPPVVRSITPEDNNCNI